MGVKSRRSFFLVINFATNSLDKGKMNIQAIMCCYNSYSDPPKDKVIWTLRCRSISIMITQLYPDFVLS